VRRIAIVVVLSLLSSPAFITFANAEVRIPANTRVHVALNKEVIGKKKYVREGDLVPARVWRDVIIDGAVVIAADTPALVKVEKLKTRKIVGIKGKLTLAILETTAADGTPVSLTGGYNKAGKGRIGLTASIGALLFWPALFIPGSAARLPADTLMNSYTVGDVTLDEINRPRYPKINLARALRAMRVEVLYEELEKTGELKWFEFLIHAPEDAPDDEYVIDNVNGNPIDPIELEVLDTTYSEDGKDVRARVEIKPLGKQFRKGINRFDIAYGSGGLRVSDEVILDIEF